VIRSRRPLATVLAGVATAALVTATATPAAAATAIGPGQYFSGVVNGRLGSATIAMACFGPTYPGQTGHPMAGQTVAVRQQFPPGTPTGTYIGYTGSAATGIAVGAGSTSTTSPLVLSSYDTPVALPTTLTLPCGGTGTVRFVPTPTSSTATVATVAVTFVGQP